jgi:ribosomal protein S21
MAVICPESTISRREIETIWDVREELAKIGQGAGGSPEGTDMQAVAEPGEPFESLLRSFKRDVERSGVLRDCRRHQRFAPNHERRREQRVTAPTCELVLNVQRASRTIDAGRAWKQERDRRNQEEYEQRAHTLDSQDRPRCFLRA